MSSRDGQIKGQGGGTGSGMPKCPAENSDMCTHWGFQPKHRHWPHRSHKSPVYHRRDPPDNKTKQAFPASASSARTDMVPAGHGSHERLPSTLWSDATRVHHCHVCFRDWPANYHSWEHIFSCTFSCSQESELNLNFRSTTQMENENKASDSDRRLWGFILDVL